MVVIEIIENSWGETSDKKKKNKKNSPAQQRAGFSFETDPAKCPSLKVGQDSPFLLVVVVPSSLVRGVIAHFYRNSGRGDRRVHQQLVQRCSVAVSDRMLIQFLVCSFFPRTILFAH